MAWMIKAGSVEKAAGGLANGLAIVAQGGDGRCGWRLVAKHRTSLAGRPGVAATTTAQVWQGVLANLIEEECSDEQ